MAARIWRSSVYVVAMPTATDIVSFYEENGIALPAVDLVAVGPGWAERAGEIAAVLCIASDGERRPVMRRILIVHAGHADVEAEVRSAFARVCEQASGSLVEDATVNRLFAAVDIQRLATLSGSEVVAKVEAAAPRTAVIVAPAAQLRLDGVAPDTRDVNLPEDIWSAHVAALIEVLGTAVEAREGYAVLDLGEAWPERPDNGDRLANSSARAIHAAEYVNRATVDFATRVGGWYEAARSGRLGAVLAEIDREPGMSAQQRTLTRLNMYRAAEIFHEVRRTLEADPALTAGLAPAAALAVATMAEEADADEVAARLLKNAMGGLGLPEELEAALRLAERLADRELAEHAEAALDRQLPSSAVLRQYRARRHAANERWGEAAELLEPDGPRTADRVRLLRMLEARLGGGGAIDAETFLEEARNFPPLLAADAVVAGASALEKAGRRDDALRMLLAVAGEGASRTAVFRALMMVETARLERDDRVDDTLVLATLEASLAHLGRFPTDGRTRLRLERILSPEVSGARGVPLLAVAVARLAEVPLRRLDVLPVHARTVPAPPDAIFDLATRVIDWLNAEGVAVFGKRIYPAAELGLDPDAAIAGLAEAVELVGDRLDDPETVASLERLAAAAAAVASHASYPHEDLIVLRLAMGKLAAGGEPQRARDYAEEALRLAGADAHRRRLAWLAFGDAYARTGDATGGLIGLGAALAADDAASADQAWHESLLQFRLFRAIGALPLARPILERARQALRELGQEAAYGFRLQTIELQLAMIEGQLAGTLTGERLSGFVAEAIRNAEAVLAAGDEATPSAFLLADVLRSAEAAGIAVPSRADAALDALRQRMGVKLAAFVKANRAAAPDAGQLAELARSSLGARYAADVANDVRNLVIMARRTLAAPVARGQADVAIYATEALADQAVRRPGPSEAPLLLHDPDGPAAAASNLARDGLAVVTLGLAKDALVRVDTVDGAASDPLVVPAERFSPERLAEWSAAFPYGYPYSRDPNVFYHSTEGLDAGDLPERAVVAASLDLQAFPPNLLRAGDALAGQSRRLAAVPSLSWLEAARRDPPATDGRLVAWVPDDEPTEGWPSLKPTLDDLRPLLAPRGAEISTAAAPPTSLRGADLAVVAVHGGLGERDRFFRALSNDAERTVSPASLADALAGTGVAVLFVCSGGRLDRHPGAATSVGLPKLLLDAGCAAVVASPWPLRVSVAPIWLAAFLPAWDRGAALIDAVYEANRAVARTFSDNPVDCLALSVFGDPLRVSASASASVAARG